MREKLIAIVLLAVVMGVGVEIAQHAMGDAILPLARATAHVAVSVNPPTPSAYTGFTVVGDFAGYGSGVTWYMVILKADSCVPNHLISDGWQGTTDSLGEFYAHIPGQPPGSYVVQVRDDFGDNSGRVCFMIS